MIPTKQKKMSTNVIVEQDKILNGIAMETKVLMFDGSIKFCHEVQVGDTLMGDDSTERHVISVLKIDSNDSKLHKITQNKGINYVINRDNYICLKLSRIRLKKDFIKLQDREYRKNDVIDIRLQNYLKLSKASQLDFKAYKTQVEFKHKGLLFDPYILGLWLVDANNTSPNEITICDIVILYECFDILKKNQMNLEFLRGHRYALNFDDTSKTFEANVVTPLQLNEIKSIPEDYKINSRDNRLRLLAGIIDSAGFVNNNCYELTLKNEVLVNDIVFMCFSLGFYTSKSIQKNSHYYRVIISGDLSQIPVLDPRKQMTIRKQIKNILHTGISIEELADVNGCLAFVIDGNGRFLTSDFTVIHS